jgi:hypothetical protein
MGSTEKKLNRRKRRGFETEGRKGGFEQKVTKEAKMRWSLSGPVFGAGSESKIKIDIGFPIRLYKGRDHRQSRGRKREIANDHLATDPVSPSFPI